jgi:ClpX C4-type zinc finger protein
MPRPNASAVGTNGGQELVRWRGVFVCERCVDLAVEAGSSGTAVAEDRIRLTPLAPDAPESCRFCGKKGPLVAYLVARGDARIGSECLGLCQEIIAKAFGPASR